MTQVLEEVKQRLPLLTKKERRTVLRLLTQMGEVAGAPETSQEHTDTDRFDEVVLVFYRAWGQVLAQETRERLPPLTVLSAAVRRDVREACGLAIELLESFAQDAKQRSISPTVRNAFFTQLAELVIAYLKRASVPISMRAMLNQRRRFGGLFDHAFPGYGAAGVLFEAVLSGEREHGGQLPRARPESVRSGPVSKD